MSDEGAAVENAEAEERVQFMLRLRARGINDLRLLRALERAPRALFMPQRYADVAWRDIAMPIGAGQTAPPPSVLAAMIQALDPAPDSRVLEVGTGTGYAASLLAQLASDVVSVERHQTLALEAASRFQAFGLDNVSALWGDGLALDPTATRYDRILVHALIEPPAPNLMNLLSQDGVLVAVVVSEGSQRIVRLTRDAGGQVVAEISGPARTARPLAAGLARAL